MINKWLIELFLLFAILFISSIRKVATIEADPLEQLVRSALLAARSFAEKTLSDISLPRSDTIMQGVQYSLQMDDKSSLALRSLYEFIDTCPICQTLPISELNGEWEIVVVSKNFLISVITDLSKTVDRLEASLPIFITKSLDTIFTSDPDMQCAKITIHDSNNISSFQIAYLSREKYRSIIGRLINIRDRYLFEFAPTISVEFCLTLATPQIRHGNVDVMILSQSDTFPSCSNFLLLTKKRNDFNVLPFLQYITRIGGNFPSNPLVDIKCTRMSN